MKKSKRQVRLFSIIASILLIFSLFTPGTIGAEANDGSKQSLVNSKTAAAKVSSRLVDEFKESDKVTFMVKLKDKADTDEVVKSVQKKSEKKGLSANESKFLQRSSVISALKATATETQQRLDDYLTQEAEAGNADDVHSYYIVNAMAVTATKDVAKKIAAFDEVEKILPNEKREIISPVESEGKAPNADDNVEWNVDRVNAPQAWDMGYDGTGTVIASIDSGVQWDHPALKEKYRGYDAESGEVDHSFSWYDATAGESEPYDDVGHGTHTIGTMVGGESDGSNQVGVAPGAKFISVKAFTAAGGTDADLIDAAEWIMAPTDEDGNERVDLAPDVVNNSWGGGAGLDEFYRDVVKQWRNAEIFPEFSAGNVDLFNPGGPGSIATPANYPESFATGATDKDDDLAGFSLQGPSPYDEIKPDISAPGVSIRSTMPGGAYGLNDGTSMAGPAVTGVAALLRQVNSSIDVDTMEEILTSTATPLTDSEFPESPNNGYGHGLVDAQNAISSMENGLGTLEGNVSGEGEDSSGDSSLKLGVMSTGSFANQLSPIPMAAKDSVDANSKVTQEEPLGATVTVTDTDRSVNTNPEDGSYSLVHPAGDFTIKAEAYGFQSAEQDVTIEDDGTTEANFTLKEATKGTIEGTVTNEATGDPIEDATILLQEDANIEPVKSDENGHYEITALEGEYTMKVIAKNFHSTTEDVTVTVDGVEVNAALEPFYTYPGDEIGYDDGTADNALAFYDAGNGWGVKMSLPEDKDTALVTDGVFKFWNDEFPIPGGTEFQVEVWDSSGEDGTPGEKIAGPIDADAIRDENQWTVVDLSGENIIVEDDFYMVYIQAGDNTEAPGLATDETSPNAERSYQYVSGDWELAAADEGNYMIRARVDYEVEKPEITSPADGDITNAAEVIVEGNASPTTSVELQNNGETVDKVEVDDDGTFSVPATLEEGNNELIAVAQVDGDNAGESDAIHVTLDATKPELTIESPSDGDKTNRETVTVEGTISDDNLDSVTVNGQEADVSDGNYSKRILLDNGKNTIEVVAVDEAGNETTESVTIDVKYDAPEVENLTPDEDVVLETGESVKIEFDSEPGLKPTFFIHMPLTNNKVQIANATELPMMEMSEGHYVGYWTVPLGVQADGGVIEVKVVDDYSNETRQETEGKLFINQ